MRKLTVALVVVTLIALFAIGPSSYAVKSAHASPLSGACWQDRCDFTWPLQEKCGNPFRAQGDVNIYDPNTGVLVGQLRMWKTGASGSGCMDTWATFAGNGNEDGQFTVTVEIDRFENIHGDNDGAFSQVGYVGGNGNHDTQNLGYEGHYEDCFQAYLSFNGNPPIADSEVCPA